MNEEQLARMLEPIKRQQVPQLRLSAPAAITEAGRQRRRLHAQVATGVTAVIAVVAIVTVPSLLMHHHDTPGRGTAPATTQPVDPLAAVLNNVTMPPGSRQVKTAPFADPVDDQPHGAASDAHNAIRTATRYWVTPLSAQQLLSWIADHHPSSFTRVPARQQSGNVLSLSFAGPTTTTTIGPNLVVSAQDQASGGSTVRADADIQTIAPDPYKVTIPASSKAQITVTFSHGSGPTTTTTAALAGASAQRLADETNALPEDTPGIADCPGISNGPQSVVVDFATSSGVVRLTWDLNCRLITFPGAPQARPRVATPAFTASLASATHLEFP